MKRTGTELVCGGGGEGWVVIDEEEADLSEEKEYENEEEK